LFIIKRIPMYLAVEALEHALAMLMVMKTEVLRLHPVREGVAPEHLTYIPVIPSATSSYARHTGEWVGAFTELLSDHAGIHGEEGALTVFDLMVNNTFGELIMAHARKAHRGPKV
jgi:hypothetical protein